MPERPNFGKRVEITGKGKVTVTTKDTVVTIEEKGPRVKPEMGERSEETKKAVQALFSNLRSLAIYAEGEIKDSFDQDHYNKALEEIKVKFSGEQPEEAWGRSIATLMGKGFSIDSIVCTLMGQNEQFDRSKTLGSLTLSMEGKKAENIRVAIKEFWPSNRNKK
jgi:hypothetical protein